MSALKRKKGFFSISAVADMFSVHQQTIRLYEKEGLITPKRSTGNTRLFSQEDVDRLEQIIYLTHELGINLAGVEMVLKLQKQIKKLQKEINSAFAATQTQLSAQGEQFKIQAKERTQRLLALKKEKTSQETNGSPVTAEQPATGAPIVDVAPWQVSYED
jgi:MerR family transcriptional regulator/heat shock protein HspR